LGGMYSSFFVPNPIIMPHLNDIELSYPTKLQNMRCQMLWVCQKGDRLEKVNKIGVLIRVIMH